MLEGFVFSNEVRSDTCQGRRQQEAMTIKAVHEDCAALPSDPGQVVGKGWTGVCAWVDEQLRGTDGTEQERRQRITDRVLAYFAKHATRLNHAERLASGRAIGSGSVEGWAKTLGLRLKARGARWNLRNVRKMAALVNVRNSGQWDTYWNAV